MDGMELLGEAIARLGETVEAYRRELRRSVPGGDWAPGNTEEGTESDSDDVVVADRGGDSLSKGGPRPDYYWRGWK